ncbi:MAG: hypothetical protein II370_05205 [Clostridia bacterium]|nr:hypothetical protein [Clostridia bacterium]
MKKLLNEMSAAELIECARVCIGNGDCSGCALYGEDSCHEALILALAGKLEELAFSEVDDGDRLTARENGHAYFVKCFEEPCAGGGCKNDNCAFIRAACEKLCRYEEGAGVYGVAWIDAKAAKPVEADEYLVMVAGAGKPTTLWYDPDEEMFYEEDCDFEPVYYSVTHWAEMPEGPKRTPSADGDGPSRTPVPTKINKRCATCRHEDRLGDEERCLECEKHNLWEERK